MSFIKSMSSFELLLSAVVLVQFCFLLPKIFKLLAGVLGVFPALSVIPHWFGGNSLLTKFLKSVFSAAITLIAVLSGYYQGYNRGYEDGAAGKNMR